MNNYRIVILFLVLDAGDLRGVYEIFNGAGVIDQLYQNVYPLAVQYATRAKQELEYGIDLSKLTSLFQTEF